MQQQDWISVFIVIDLNGHKTHTTTRDEWRPSPPRSYVAKALSIPPPVSYCCSECRGVPGAPPWECSKSRTTLVVSMKTTAVAC